MLVRSNGEHHLTARSKRATLYMTAPKQIIAQRELRIHYWSALGQSWDLVALFRGNAYLTPTTARDSTVEPPIARVTLCLRSVTRIIVYGESVTSLINDIT
ncbi:PREDICTED: uncharacterized protein LOC105563378 [Vollenhovia emeryi]|uniref:uncharacterized protein LOC105563378 n=1 Tax=Vollenhovia emeryi TaxID=411798 RepID=UPI0005F55488|nr:PREDICTED: uncharacterized protein LOC105563378 [Vollenhovia emeryi]